VGAGDAMRFQGALPVMKAAVVYFDELSRR
jgi:hypothetical protein